MSALGGKRTLPDGPFRSEAELPAAQTAKRELSLTRLFSQLTQAPEKGTNNDFAAERVRVRKQTCFQAHL